MILLLLACGSPPTDTAVVTACDCSDPVTVSFSPETTGGFDDWAGDAVAWAVDPAAGLVVVVATTYELGTGQIDLAASCEDPDALVGSWYTTVPDSAADDVTAWPLLGAAVTNAAGVRSLSEPLGALLLVGDVTQATPDEVWVVTDGGMSLQRNDGGDRLLGGLSFAGRADAVGGDATVDCELAPRVAALDLEFPSTGHE